MEDNNFNNLPIKLKKKIIKRVIITNQQIYNSTVVKSSFINDCDKENNNRLEFKTNECYNNSIYVISLSLVCKHWATTIIPLTDKKGYPFVINNKRDYQLFLKWYQHGLIERTKKWYGKIKLFNNKKKSKPKFTPIKFNMDKVIINYIQPPELQIPKDIQNISLKSLNYNNGNGGGNNFYSFLQNIYQDNCSDGSSINEFDLSTGGNGNSITITTSPTCNSLSSSNNNCGPSSNGNGGLVASGSMIHHSISNGNISSNASSSTTPTSSPKLTNQKGSNGNSTPTTIYGYLQQHSTLQSLKIKMNSINAKETDILIDIINKNSKLKYLEIDRSEITGYNVNIGGSNIKSHDIALYDTISNLLHLQELNIQMTLTGTPIYHLGSLVNIKKLYVEFIPSSTSERCDWNNLEYLLRNAPEIETLSIKDCNRVPFQNIFTVMTNNRSLTELDIQECISPNSIFQNSSSGNLSNMLPLSNNNSGTTIISSNISSIGNNNNTSTRVLASHIDEFPYLGLKEFLSTNNYIQSLSLRYTGLASQSLLNSNSTEFQLSSSSLEKLTLYKLNDQDKLNISFNIPTLKELVLLPYRNRGLIRFLKTSKKITRLSLYKPMGNSLPSKSCFEMDELFKTINKQHNLQAFYNHNYYPQINAIEFIKSNHPTIKSFIHCNDNLKHMENDLIEAISINTKLESLTIMFNSSVSSQHGVDEGDPSSELCPLMIIFKLISQVLVRNQTLKSLKIIDCSKDYHENVHSCSTGFGCPHFGYCKLNNANLTSIFKSTNIIQFNFPWYLKKYFEKYLLNSSKLYSFILKDNELLSF